MAELGSLAYIELTQASNVTLGTSVDTGAVAPVGNTLVMVAVWSTRSAGSTVAPTLSGNGLTYVQIATIELDTTRRVTLFRALGASPTSGAITIAHSTLHDVGGWVVWQVYGTVVTGTDGDEAIVQSATTQDDASPAEITLAAFTQQANAGMVVFAADQNTAITPDANWTEQDDRGGAGPQAYRQEVQTIFNADDVTASATQSGGTFSGIAVELASKEPRTSQLLLSASIDPLGTSHVTASVTPAADKLILFSLISTRTAGLAAEDPPTLSGNGLTWVEVGTVLLGTTRRLTVFRAQGSAPSSGAVTITHGVSHDSGTWDILEFDDVPVSGDGASAVHGVATQSDVAAVSLPFSVLQNIRNGVVVHVIRDTNGAVVQKTGWSELDDNGFNPDEPHRHETHWSNLDDSPLEATGGTDMSALGVEIGYPAEPDLVWFSPIVEVRG